jgi:alkylation response protein AidB-like acyl-CoA dehydrogenase
VEPAAGESQRFWQETARRFLEAQAPIAHARGRIGHPDGYDRPLYRRMAGLGWTAPLVPEDLGGGSVSGHPVSDLAVVAGELGRTLTPTPVLEANLAAAAVRIWGSTEHQQTMLPGIASGEITASVASAAPSLDGWNESAEGLMAEPAAAGGWALTGARSPVAFGRSVDLLVTSALRADQGVSLFLVGAGQGAVRYRALESFDLTRPLAGVDFEGVALGEDSCLSARVAEATDVGAWLALAAVWQTADTVGALGRAFEITLEYAKDRRAFGRAIGSFQAIKHRLADMALWLEWCRAASSAAVEAADEWWANMLRHRSAAVRTEGGAASTRAAVRLAEAASVAQSVVGEFGPGLVRSALQVHGGIGYTWEHDIHLFLRRVEANAALGGTTDFHRDRLARLVGFPDGQAR